MFDLWQEYQRAPERCKFSEPRKKLIYARMRDHSADNLCALVRYAFEADVPEARFWRGGNVETREYLQLENLFRVGTLDGRVENALTWLAGEDPHDPDGPAAPEATSPGPVIRPRAPAPPAPPPVQQVRGRSLRRVRP